MEAPWPLVLASKQPPDRETNHPEDARRQKNTQVGRGGDRRETEGLMTIEPPRGLQGPWCRLRATKGGRTDVGNGSRRRHEERGSETSGEGWQVVGVGDVHVYDAPLQERRCGEGDT